MTDPIDAEAPNPLDNPEYRLEAGEGWHVDGLNRTLLGAIVVREILIHEAAETEYGPRRERALHEYKEQAAFVEAMMGPFLDRHKQSQQR